MSPVALVTGGAGGIGAAVARRLGAAGTRVVVADLDAPAPDAADRFIAVDVADEGSVARCFDAVEEAFGPVDVLVNNAGLAHGPEVERHFLHTDPGTWDRVVSVNLRGAYLCTARFVQTLVERGLPGCVVNVTTAGARRAHRNRVAYDASKGGLEAATRALALDLAPYGIRVNAVAPGAIDVPGRTPVGSESDGGPERVVPLGRLGDPEDVAAAVAFLASDDAAYVTGASLAVDGGLLAQLRSPAVDAPAPGPHHGQ